MAPHQTATLSFLTLIFLLNSSSAYSLVSHSDSNKVSLDLYYESLCPYSANFIVNYLIEVFEDDDLLSIVDLHLFPWGNAKLKPNNTFACQHGPYECVLNTVEACAIHAWPQLEVHFRFIYCVESLVLKHNYTDWGTCFDELNLDPKPVLDCYSSGFGKKLELQYAAETNALQPPHEYVPWVVVNGKPLYEDYENYKIYICEAYKGTDAPKACIGLSHYHRRRENARKIIPVCYKDTKISALVEQIKSAISKWMQQMNWAASM